MIGEKWVKECVLLDFGMPAIDFYVVARNIRTRYRYFFSSPRSHSSLTLEAIHFLVKWDAARPLMTAMPATHLRTDTGAMFSGTGFLPRFR